MKNLRTEEVLCIQKILLVEKRDNKDKRILRILKRIRR